LRESGALYFFGGEEIPEIPLNFHVDGAGKIRYIIGMSNGEQKPSKARRFVQNIGKLILDATKLCFGSLVLGAAIKGEIPQDLLMLVGIIISAGGAVVGIVMVTLSEEK
jgi:hypothetical protein